LPENKDEIKIEIFRMKNHLDGTLIDKIKTNKQYQFIIGSVVTGGTISAKIDKYYLVKLNKPICTICDRCLIYDTETKLIGYGLFDNNNIENKNLNIPQTEEEYLQLLSDKEDKKKDKISVPIPSLARENKNVIWSNITTFCQIIKREPSQISSYIREELCMEATICQNGLRMVKANINSTKLQKVLKKYIIENVCCEQCKSLNTVMEKNKARGYQNKCLNCGSENQINNLY
jgi:translation initiation factor 2 beta subunit (eIF-2beta)/eIF-5